MRCETVSLYEHYHLDRPEGSRGFLTCLIPDNTPELNANRLHPAILVIPGGAYVMVSAREAEPIALRFVSQGYAAFVLNYSVAPVRFPVALREAAMAMKYIRENAQELTVNPNMVAAMGFSAGGHLCGTLGTLFDAPEVADIAPAQIIRPDALGLCYPVTISYGRAHAGSFRNLTGSDPELTERLSLDRLVRSDMPPVFLWHTYGDAAVPVMGSMVLGQTLAEHDVPFAMEIHRLGGHGLCTADDTTHLSHRMPIMSKGIFGWEQRMGEFFRECGIKIVDDE